MAVRRYREWSRAVDATTDEGREYVGVVGVPMELATLLARVNDGRVSCPSSFDAPLRRIVECAEKWHTSAHADENAVITI